MIQYLTAATLLWAFTLLVYELCFRRLQMHAENRAYLLTSLALGLLLPLVKMPLPDAVPGTVLYTLHQTVVVREQLAATVMPAAAPQGTGLGWLLIAYLAGVACFLTWMLGQAWWLARALRSARRERVMGATVLRTRGQHPPFSFFGCIALPECTGYPPCELRMILRHEQAHVRLWHSADIVVLQALRVVLWFHPLVHHYYRRLRMVHEFQADAVQREDAADYGRFLIHQAMQAHAPALAHSFYQSPLKTRIAMLLKTSRATRLRYFAVLALLPVFLLCAAHDGNSSRQRGVSLNGHTIRLERAKDTIHRVAPANLSISSTISPGDTIPVAVDNEPIQELTALSKMPVFNGNFPSLREYVFHEVQPLLNQLPDGNYGFIATNVVLDKSGRIAYYEWGGITISPVVLFQEGGEIIPGITLDPEALSDSTVVQDILAAAKAQENNQSAKANMPPGVFSLKNKIEPKLKARIDAKAQATISNARYTPGAVQGAKVAVAMSFNELDFFVGDIIVVKGGKATLTKAFGISD